MRIRKRALDGPVNKHRHPTFLVSVGVLLLAVFACGSPPNLTPAPELPDPVQGPYRVQVADVLQVRFFRTPELTQTATVGPDGVITLALVGGVFAAGRTIDDLGEIVRVLYADADLLEPQITISVQTYSGMKVYVAGEVNTPGMLEYRGGLTLVQAIMEAGGFLNTARASHVLVIRRGSEGQPLGSQVDVDDILTDGRFGADIALAPSDIVFVPRSIIANINLFIEQYITNMIPQPFYWLGYEYLIRN